MPEMSDSDDGLCADARKRALVASPHSTKRGGNVWLAAQASFGGSAHGVDFGGSDVESAAGWPVFAHPGASGPETVRGGTTPRRARSPTGYSLTNSGRPTGLGILSEAD